EYPREHARHIKVFGLRVFRERLPEKHFQLRVNICSEYPERYKCEKQDHGRGYFPALEYLTFLPCLAPFLRGRLFGFVLASGSPCEQLEVYLLDHPGFSSFR